MKVIKLSVVAIALASLAFLSFKSEVLLNDGEHIPLDKTENNDPLLLQKWTLDYYEVFGSNFPPETIEKDDYIHFYADKTFASVSEGVFEGGDYEWLDGAIIMTSKTEEGTLKLIVKTLTKTRLSVSIDDPNDDDAKYLTIHFKN